MPRYSLPIKPRIIIDTREKLPWDFDEDDDFDGVIVQKLDSGDYSIEGMEEIITVERKKSVDELYNNLCNRKSADRVVRELERMPPHRYFIIEQTWEQIFTTGNYYVNKLPSRDKRRPRSPYQPRSIVLGYLLDFMIAHNVRVIAAGTQAKTLAKRILLDAYQRHRRDALGT